MIITALARQTRKFTADIMKKKWEEGLASNVEDKEADVFEETGFHKDTRVRINLMREVTGNFPVKSIDTIYTSGAQVAGGTHSDNYKIQLDDLYNIAGPGKPGRHAGLRFGVRPGASYRFEISMYQKGVPFYAQDCEDPKNVKAWNCRLGLRGENNWYSQPVLLKFKVKRTADDQRGLTQRVSNFMGRNLLGKLWDWMTE
jgi:hypothetical protein